MIAYASEFSFPSSLSKLTWSPSFLFVANAAFFFTLSLTAFLFSGALAAANTQQAVLIASTKNTSGTAILELHIASDGLILLRNAQVVSVSGNTILVSTKWGSTDLHWAVLTNRQLRSMQNIRPGDFLTISGMLDTSAQSPTLTAKNIQESN